jgi:hypothetical protein
MVLFLNIIATYESWLQRAQSTEHHRASQSAFWMAIFLHHFRLFISISFYFYDNWYDKIW